MNRRDFLKSAAAALVATRLLFPLRGEVVDTIEPGVELLGSGVLKVKQENEWVTIGTVTEIEITLDRSNRVVL